MTDHMQLQRKTVGQSADTPASVIPSAPISAPTATLQKASETPTQAEPKAESAEPAPEQEPQSSFLNYDFGRLPIFAKLTVGQPNDPYEQEADRVAEQVMRMPDRTPHPSPSVQGYAGHDFGQIALSPESIDSIGTDQGEVSPLAASVTPFVQRDTLPNAEEIIEEPESTTEVNTSELLSVEEEKEELLQTKPALQRANQGNEAEPGLEQQLTQSQGGGNPLPDETRRFMESRFGADFGSVQVHTDDNAVQMNRQLQAQAFTHGNDIYFGAGQTPGKNDLTAHELTHTIQQTGQVTNSSNAPVVKDSEQFGSASHNWQPAIPSQIQKSPISAGAVFSIQRQAVSSNQVGESQDVQQIVSPAISTPAISTPSVEDENRPPSPSIPERVSPTRENPYKSKPAPENKPAASTQDNPQNIKQNHKVTPPTSSGSAQNDPDFQAVAARGQQVAQAEQQHEPAEAESREAQDAAQSPVQEVTSQAQDRQVGEMAEQEPGEFNAEAFRDAIFEKLKQATPETQEDAENFDQENELDTVRQEVSSDVSQERDQAAAPIEETTQEEPDPSGIEPRRDTPMHPPDRGAAPGGIGAERATPKPRSDAEVSQPLAANQQEVEQQMAEADITEEQLANANEPEFSAALDSKREVDADAEQAPDAYRQQEQATLNQAQTDAQTTAATQLEGMHDQRQDSMTQVEGLQGETRSVDEQKRLEIANHINGIYDRVKGEVDTSLNTLETDVTSKFDRAANTARQEFEDYVKREEDKFKFDRYFTSASEPGKDLAENLGASESVANVVGELSAPLVSAGRRIDDLTGLPPELEEIFAEGRRRYLADMSVALDGIANTVADRLNEAMQKIENGRQEIQRYVDSLPANLRQIGQEAANDIESKFDQLEQQVRDKHDELVNTLAQKYQERLEEIDSRIEELKAENRGLLDRAMDAIGGVIQTINEIKAMLQGLLADAMNAIGKILKDPIGFLSNLLTGLQQGFQNFLGNIGEHLQSGLVGWLTGAMGSMGIQIPDDIFSLKGIFDLVMQILGLSWDYIRDKAVRMFGEPVVSAMEESVELFQVLRNDGPQGLWEEVQSQFNDLQETVMDEVKSMIIEQVIQAGITWVLSLFSPVGAFVRAAKMIIDVVKFFIERGSQVIELVRSIIRSINAIADGSTGAAAQAIEESLSRSVPVLIGFLASLLGIGGLANKVQEIFERIRKRIDDAIEWVLEKAKKLVKGKKNEGDEENGEDGEKIELEDGKVGETINFSAPDEEHSLWTELEDSKPVVMVASTKSPAAQKLKEIEGVVSQLPPTQQTKTLSLIERGYSLLGEVSNRTTRRLNELQNKLQIEDASASQARQELETRLRNIQESQQLAYVFQELFEIIFNYQHQGGKQMDEQGNPTTADVDPEYAARYYHQKLRDALRGGLPMDSTNSEGSYHRPPDTIAVVVDRHRENHAYFGMSAGESQIDNPNDQTENNYRREHLEPYLQDRIRILEDRIEETQQLGQPLGLPNRPATNCAECEATDKALKARSGTNSYEGLEGVAASSGGRFERKPPCGNCEIVYGAEDESSSADIFRR